MSRRLSDRKTRLLFVTDSMIRERGKLREIVIEAKPGYAVIRLHGTRRGFPISYDAMYHHAAKMAAEQARAEKRAAKKQAATNGRRK